MISSLTLEEFLDRNLIDNETWETANIDWGLLKAIASDHEKHVTNLENAAELFAKVIQKFKGVHSVRWRVKNSEHLAEKIVRKRAEGNTKYTDINLDNYYEIITDLVGIRALHLFKEDCFEIVDNLSTKWDSSESIVAYIRGGDSEGMKEKFEETGFEVRNHPAGYRSVHYITELMHLKRKLFVEIQIRTIFEECWSEIDHKIRYPNFVNNELVDYFLEIFNRMAGSADDMGGFVLGLVASLSGLKKEIDIAKQEKAAIFEEMEQALSLLENQKKQNQASKDSISKLKAEIYKLKDIKHNDVGLGIPNRTLNGLFGLRALEQAHKGLLGLDALDQARKSMAGLGAFEQARKGLLGLGALDKASKSMVGLGAIEQQRIGLLGLDTLDKAQKKMAGLDGLDHANKGVFGDSLNQPRKGITNPNKKD